MDKTSLIHIKQTVKPKCWTESDGLTLARSLRLLGRLRRLFGLRAERRRRATPQDAPALRLETLQRSTHTEMEKHVTLLP